MKEMTMICPRCDNQGLIYKAKVLNLDLELYICDECDACWPINQIIGINNFKDLTVFFEEHTLTYEDAEIEDLGYLNLNEEKRLRTFFNVSGNELIALVDEAWLMKGSPVPFDLGAYVIDMKRIIGTNGESVIKIIVKPGTAEIKTAYPVKI
jgi:hypothetical protein